MILYAIFWVVFLTATVLFFKKTSRPDAAVVIIGSHKMYSILRRPEDEVHL